MLFRSPLAVPKAHHDVLAHRRSVHRPVSVRRLVRRHVLVTQVIAHQVHQRPADQARLAGPRQAGDHREDAERQLQVDIVQVVDGHAVQSELALNKQVLQLQQKGHY